MQRWTAGVALKFQRGRSERERTWFRRYILLAGVCVVWLHACRHWQRRNYSVDSADMPTGGFTFGYLLNVLLLFGRLFVHAFFPLVFALCSYYFLFFKLQKSAYLLMPAENRHDGKDFEHGTAARESFGSRTTERLPRRSPHVVGRGWSHRFLSEEDRRGNNAGTTPSARR